MLVRALVLALLLAVTGCSGSTPTAAPTPSDPPGPAVLLEGKSGEPLEAGTYLSPDGFVPPLVLKVPTDWTTTHRGDDAFDLSRPDPSKDAPLVVVALITPPGDDVATTLAAMRRAAKGRVTPATGVLAGQPATGFEEVGGSGVLISSPSGTLSLDASPTGHLSVLGVTIDDVPLLLVVDVPDGTHWAEQRDAVAALVSGISAA